MKDLLSVVTSMNLIHLFAGEGDFIEVCEWKNGEGFDIAINDRHYSFTHGELKAINYLIDELNKK